MDREGWEGGGGGGGGGRVEVSNLAQCLNRMDFGIDHCKKEKKKVKNTLIKK